MTIGTSHIFLVRTERPHPRPSKAVAQRLQDGAFLGQFPHTIVHIPGDENYGGGPAVASGDAPRGPVCVRASAK